MTIADLRASLVFIGGVMKNTNGFSLTEVMISMLIMSIVMLGTAQMINHVMLVSQTADAKANLMTLVTSAAGVAANQATCTAAVTQTPQTLSDKFRFDTLQTDTTLASYGLSVVSLTYDNAQLIQTGADGSKVYHGTILLSVASIKDVYGSKLFAPRTIASVYLTMDPAGVVVSCGSVMPTLPAAPPANDVPALPQPLADDVAVRYGCTTIGGEMSDGVCTIHSDHSGDCGR